MDDDKACNDSLSMSPSIIFPSKVRTSNLLRLFEPESHTKLKLTKKYIHKTLIRLKRTEHILFLILFLKYLDGSRKSEFYYRLNQDLSNGT